MRTWFNRTFGLEAPAWRFFALVGVLVALLTGVLVLTVHPYRPTPNEFCADHGGVRYLSAGGFATPDAATCRDGYAGRVYP